MTDNERNSSVDSAVRGRLKILEDELRRAESRLEESERAVAMFGEIRERLLAERSDLLAFLDLRVPLNPGDCPHGYPIGTCSACDIASDLAYDSARERGR